MNEATLTLGIDRLLLVSRKNVCAYNESVVSLCLS